MTIARWKAIGICLLAATGAAASAGAENRALIVTAGDTPGFQLEAVAQRYRVAGFATTAAGGLDSAQLLRPFEALEAADPAAGARVVVLAGRFVSGGGEVWLLGGDAQRPGLLGADRAGIGVSRVIALMSDSQAPRVLLLAEAAASNAAPGPRLRRGVGPIAGLGSGGSNGVSVVAGPAAAVAQAASDLAAPDASLAAILLSQPELRLISGPAEGGSVSIARGQPPVAGQSGGSTVPVGGLTLPAAPGEPEAWVRAAAAGDVQAYQQFLQQFPDGRYGAVARERLARLGGQVPEAPPASGGQTTPTAGATEAAARAAALAEIALTLSVGERAQIQRILTEAGFDTRGADGQFGAGTRQALRAWQQRQGLPATGYVDETTLRALRASVGLR